MSEAQTPSETPAAAPASEAASTLPNPSGEASVAAPEAASTVPAGDSADALPGDGSLLAEAAPENKDEAKPEGADSATAGALDVTKLTLPEGLTVDDTLMGSFQETAAAAGLSQEAAQSMLDLYGKTVQSQVDAAAKQLAEASAATWKDVNTQWLAELEAVPDFAGDNKKASLAVIAKALEEYGVGDVRQAFALTGAGNNPVIVQTFLKMARALSEGTSVPAGAPVVGPRTSGEVLYGDSAANKG